MQIEKLDRKDKFGNQARYRLIYHSIFLNKEESHNSKKKLLARLTEMLGKGIDITGQSLSIMWNKKRWFYENHSSYILIMYFQEQEGTVVALALDSLALDSLDPQ